MSTGLRVVHFSNGDCAQCSDWLSLLDIDNYPFPSILEGRNAELRQGGTSEVFYK